MSVPDAIADALALGFLAGDWNRSALIDRAVQILGERPRWLSSLVRSVLSSFPDAPHDAHESLSRAILRFPGLRRSYAPGARPPRLSKLLISEPSMGARRWPVPVLATTTALADWLGLLPAELDWFADVKGLNASGVEALSHYAFHWQPKKHGGYRLLEAPKFRLKALQRSVLHELLDLVPPHDAAHGFVRGRSPVSCARAHAGRELILRLDLEEFFPSVGSPRVYRIFRGFGYPEPVARALTGLCTLKVSNRVVGGMPALSFVEQYDRAALIARHRTRSRLRHRHLAQGAPTSPALANLACYRLDARLSGAARSVGAVYTRYADDLTFSGGEQLARRAGRFESLVAGIAIEEGFLVNHHKTRRMPRSQTQSLLGLVVNEQPNVPRATRDRIEAVLTNVLRHGLETQSRRQDPRFVESLRGTVAWIQHVNPRHAQKLVRLLNACEAQGRLTPTE